MKIKIKLEKKSLLIILILSSVFLIMSVYAYNSIYKNPSYFGHSAGEIDGFVGAIPSGFCILTVETRFCPKGFEHGYDNFNGRALRFNSSNVGEVGGSSSHTHKRDPDITRYSRTGTDPIDDVLNASSWPPYVNVSVCCKI